VQRTVTRGDLNRDRHAFPGEGRALGVLQLYHRLGIERDAGGGGGRRLGDEHQLRGHGRGGEGDDVFRKGRGHRRGAVAARLAAQHSLCGGAAVGPGYHRGRLNIASALGAPGNLDSLNRVPETVRHPDDERIGGGLQDGARLPVAGNFGDVGGLALVGEHEVASTARPESEQHGERDCRTQESHSSTRARGNGAKATHGLTLPHGTGVRKDIPD
jgi:hypothetical protein